MIMFTIIVFLAGVITGAAWYKVVRPTISKWTNGKLFNDGVGGPPAPSVGGLRAVQGLQGKEPGKNTKASRDTLI